MVAVEIKTNELTDAFLAKGSRISVGDDYLKVLKVPKHKAGDEIVILAQVIGRVGTTLSMRVTGGF